MFRPIKLLSLACALLGATAFAAPARAADEVIIKLGTMAPEGSIWHKLLKEMGEEWAKVSGGKVKLRLYAGGVAGDESAMLRKMKLGQLQAAALSAVGLQGLERSPQAVATPGLITSDAEWEYIFAKMQPIWGKRIADKGYVPLMWGDTGWVHLFFSKEIRTPAQAKGSKVFTWAGDPSAVKAWEAAGFQPVVLSATDITPSLATGMIEGVANTAVMAFTSRFYERAPYSPEVTWGHLPGATVVSKSTWEKIPEALRPKLIEIATAIAAKINTEAARLDANALLQMQKSGLKRFKLDAEETKAWQALAEKTWPLIRGGVVSQEEFDEVKRLRDEFRKQGSDKK